MTLTCFDDRNSRRQQNLQGGKRWLERMSKREQMKEHESRDNDMKQPLLIDYRKMNGQEKNVFSNDWNDNHIRRSERIKHFFHLRALCHDSSEDEDLKSESEILSTNGCSPTLIAIPRHQEVLSEGVRMNVDNHDKKSYLKSRSTIDKRHNQLMYYTGEKRRMRRRHWHVKSSTEILKNHKNKERCGYADERNHEMKVKLNASKRVINKHESLGSGYFGAQRRSLRLINKIE
jgi:hypothetical protein